MAYITKCDVCGHEIRNIKSGVSLVFRPIGSSVCAYSENVKTFDLCKKCVGRLNKAMKALSDETDCQE